MNELADCTALIRSFERPQCVARLVASIRELYPELSIVVGDDSFKPQPRSDVEWLSVGVDVGMSRGRNALLEAVRTPYFLMLDDDYVFNPHTRIELLMEVVRAGTADIATGLCREPNGKWSRLLNFLFENKRMTAVIIPTKPPITFCDAGSPFFVANTEAVRGAGGWDDEFRGSSEHPIFYVRMKQAGRKVACVPAVWCDHLPDRRPEYMQYRIRESFWVPVNRGWVECPPNWRRYGIHSIKKVRL